MTEFSTYEWMLLGFSLGGLAIAGFGFFLAWTQRPGRRWDR